MRPPSQRRILIGYCLTSVAYKVLIIVVFLVFLTTVAPFAMPQLVQKFYAIKDRRAIRIGMVASTAFAGFLPTEVSADSMTASAPS